MTAVTHRCDRRHNQGVKLKGWGISFQRASFWSEQSRGDIDEIP
jgi:hypothetical protein